MDDAWRVFVVDGSAARLTPVEVGKNNGRFAQVVAGIREGDRVITHPGDSIEDGVVVEQR